jgi:nicotinate-nucleotide adenylyltransferase
MSKLAVLGGTFDPFHNGHLTILKEIEKLPGIYKIIIMPTFIPPHKNEATASAEERIEMLKLVEKNYPKYAVDCFEINNHALSYTINTVEYLKNKYPDKTLNLVIGSDNYFILHTWKKYLKLIQEVDFIVINREKMRLRKYFDYKEHYFADADIKKFKFIEIEPVNIASKNIRQARKKGESIKEMVPSFIEEYILEKGLYL